MAYKIFIYYKTNFGGNLMSLIGKEIVEFTADAYHAGNGKFITVSSEI